MKIVKTASGKQKIKLSKKEWQDIGKKAGWMKIANDEKSIKTAGVNQIRDKIKSLEKAIENGSIPENEVEKAEERLNELYEWLSEAEDESYMDSMMEGRW